MAAANLCVCMAIYRAASSYLRITITYATAQFCPLFLSGEKHHIVIMLFILELSHSGEIYTSSDSRDILLRVATVSVLCASLHYVHIPNEKHFQTK